MSERIEPQAREVYGRLWQYVTPHKLIGLIAVIGMTATAIIEGGLVQLLEPLLAEALVAQNLTTAKWLPIAFVTIFILRGISGFATEASLGWIGRIFGDVSPAATSVLGSQALTSFADRDCV